MHRSNCLFLVVLTFLAGCVQTDYTNQHSRIKKMNFRLGVGEHAGKLTDHELFKDLRKDFCSENIQFCKTLETRSEVSHYFSNSTGTLTYRISWRAPVCESARPCYSNRAFIYVDINKCSAKYDCEYTFSRITDFASEAETIEYSQEIGSQGGTALAKDLLRKFCGSPEFGSQCVEASNRSKISYSMDAFKCCHPRLKDYDPYYGLYGSSRRLIKQDNPEYRLAIRHCRNYSADAGDFSDCLPGSSHYTMRQIECKNNYDCSYYIQKVDFFHSVTPG